MRVAGGQVLRSVAWSSAGALSMRVGQFLVGIVAARLLAPHDFGVFAITLAVYAIVVNVSELGVGSALIRQNENLEKVAPTAVTLSLLSATALAAILWAVAPLVAEGFGAEDATDPVRVMSIVVLLAGPSAVPAAILTRNFRQDLRFRADGISFVVSNGLLIVLALMGLGPLALAWSRVAGQLASVITLIIVAPKFRPGFNRAEAAHLLRFGMPLVGANLAGFALGSVDSLVIGRLGGTVQLGFYTLANNIASWPLGLSSSVLVNVGLPLMSKVRGDTALLSRYLTNALRALSGVFFYVTAMCVGLAYPLVEAVYGVKWQGAAPVLAVLAAYGSARVIMALFGEVLVACGETRSLFWIQIVWIVFLIPAMIGGMLWLGIVGVALAQVVVGAALVLPLTVAVAHRRIGIPVSPVLLALIWPLVAAAMSGAVAHVVSLMLPGPWPALLGGGVAGTVVYAALMVRWSTRLRMEIRVLYATEPSARLIDALEDTDVHVDSAPALFEPSPTLVVPAALPRDELTPDPADARRENGYP